MSMIFVLGDVQNINMDADPNPQTPEPKDAAEALAAWRLRFRVDPSIDLPAEFAEQLYQIAIGNGTADLRRAVRAIKFRVANTLR